jgi:cytochrome c peroxidase
LRFGIFGITPIDASPYPRFQPNGPTTTSSNAFFQVLGSNGRSCFTCHQPQDGWTISARSVRERFRDDPGEPLFRPIDGANCPSDDISTLEAKRKAFSLLLDKADIRSGIALPQSRQFEILSVNDLYNCTTNPTTGLSAIPTTGSTTGAVSLYRRPLPTTNIGFLTTLQWDGRELDLFGLGLRSTRNRLESTTDPTPAITASRRHTARRTRSISISSRSVRTRDGKTS